MNTTFRKHRDWPILFLAVFFSVGQITAVYSQTNVLNPNLKISSTLPPAASLLFSKDFIVSRDLNAVSQAANGKVSSKGNAKRGLDLILNKRYLPPDFDQETFDSIWMVWPDKLRRLALSASDQKRLQMAFDRYGFTPRENDPLKPLQYVVDNEGKWSMNCFACHGGRLYDNRQSFPGLPNNRIALETLYEDIRAIKRKLKKPFSGMDIGSAIIPMGTTAGTSNAVIFGVSLMAFRDSNLDLKSVVIPPYVIHHDMDAPPWWHYKRKKMIYIDGFTEKHHRGLMPFIMVKQNHGERFRGFEDDFVHIQEFILNVETPKFRGSINRSLAAKGKKIFQSNCQNCHGSYGSPSTFPEKTIELDEIETDPVRLKALSKNYRQRYGKSWLADFGKSKTVIDPVGYVAPPLDGIWASAPYFHNGSVPTLRGVIQPSQRPTVWTWEEGTMDLKRMGLKVIELPEDSPHLHPSEAAKKRLIFDTRRYGKSNQGHEFGSLLSDTQSLQLLEYLKTL